MGLASSWPGVAPGFFVAHRWAARPESTGRVPFRRMQKQSGHIERFLLDKSLKSFPRGERTAVQKVGVVLVGRGSMYSRQPGEELAALAEYLRFCDAGWLVAEALLEQGGPSLPDALDTLGCAGVEKVILLPAFMPMEIATRNWLRFVARRWQEEAGAKMEVVIAGPLAAQDGVRDAVVKLAREAAMAVSPPVCRGQQPGAPEADWSVIPTHDHHVLFCQGPRCTTAGAAELGAFFRKRLKEEGLDEGPNHVLAARTGCLYPCNLGPVMVVYPEGTWYCGLDETVLSEIVDRHFLNGETVESHALRPGPNPQSLPDTIHQEIKNHSSNTH